MYEVCYQLDDVIVKTKAKCNSITVMNDMIYCGDDLIVNKDCFICATKIEETKVEIGPSSEGPVKLLNTGIARRGMLW